MMTDTTEFRRWAAIPAWHGLFYRKSRVYVLVMSLAVVALAPDARAAAPEYLADEQPAPASVEDERAPME